MADISIIICTYNPDPRILNRCLTAVSSLKKDGLNVECFLIDNNSSTPVSEDKSVISFLEKCSWAQLLKEPKPGLVNARLCGYHKSSAPVIVFFDDDNEPEENYLLVVSDYIKRNPKVGMFGPGVVKVEFVDGAPKWLDKYKWFFQEIELTTEESDNITDGYKTCYPYGTGLVVYREIMSIYIKEVIEKGFSTTGRIGNVLRGGEDVQMVWLGLKAGYFAGRTPLLRVNHLINKPKANFEYLKRLSYGGGTSCLSARYEVFPEERKNVENMAAEVRKSIIRLGKIFVLNFYKPRYLVISLASQLGILENIYQINNRKIPKFHNWLTKLLKLKN